MYEYFRKTSRFSNMVYVTFSYVYPQVFLNKFLSAIAVQDRKILKECFANLLCYLGVDP